MSDTPMHLHPPVTDRSTDLPSHPGHMEITGLVSHPRALSGPEFASLPRAHYIEEFVSKRGDGTMVRRWGGFPLLEVLSLAQPLDTARYVRVCAGSYALPVALAEAQAALCCDELDGQPLPERHGAPWRLLLSGKI
jgi:DMSO/TMAO reductase YedYZ molybdopterin-dependent catalytic subunit